MDQPTILRSFNQLKIQWDNVQQSYIHAMKTKEQPNVMIALEQIEQFKKQKRIVQRMALRHMELEEKQLMDKDFAIFDINLLNKQKKELKNLPYYERLSSLEELSERNWLIMPQNTTTVSNTIGEKLKEVGMNFAELAKRTGNSRQALSFISKNQPCTLTTALKISEVLSVSVEELFFLTEDAWCVSPLNHGATTLYLNLQTLELMENAQKREQIQTTNYTHWDQAKKQALTLKEAQQKIGENIVPLYQEIGTRFIPTPIKKEK